MFETKNSEADRMKKPSQTVFSQLEQIVTPAELSQLPKETYDYILFSEGLN